MKEVMERLKKAEAEIAEMKTKLMTRDGAQSMVRFNLSLLCHSTFISKSII